MTTGLEVKTTNTLNALQYQQIVEDMGDDIWCTRINERLDYLSERLFKDKQNCSLTRDYLVEKFNNTYGFYVMIPSWIEITNIDNPKIRWMISDLITETILELQKGENTNE